MVERYFSRGNQKELCHHLQGWTRVEVSLKYANFKGKLFSLCEELLL